MSVVGIDFGSYNTVIAVARNRGIDVICNEVSNRATPSLVSFGPRQRYLGESAKTQELGNFKNTVSSLKRLLGRSMSEKNDLAIEKEYINCELTSIDNTVGAKVQYLEQDKEFTYTQLVGMFLTKVKEITENELKVGVTDVVLSIPVYYTDQQRRALIDAAEIAGLNSLRLFHDISAAALQWGITKTDLPEDKPRHVAFVDLGHSDYTVSIVGFQKGKMATKSIAYDRHFGGRNFDDILVNYFVESFKEKYKIDLRTNPKALFRLRTSCEKVKKVLSANAQAPLNVECLMNDIDVNGLIERTQFEELAQPILNRIEGPLQRALEIAGLKKEDIDSIELVGGSTRVPLFKERIRNFFGMELSTTLNQDESIAKGCALMCAILSPVFQVRQFQVEDMLPYPVKLIWEAPASAAANDPRDMQAFTAYSVIPTTKLLTFHRREAFDVEAYYSDPNMLPAGAPTWIGKCSIKNVKPSTGGKDDLVTVKLKARLNPSGILEMQSAQAYEDVLVEEKIEAPPKSPKKEDPKSPKKEEPKSPKKDDKGPAPMDTDPNPGDKKKVEAEQVSAEINEKAPQAAAASAAAADSKVKKVTRKTDLPVVDGSSSIPKPTLQKLREQELEMFANDRLVLDTEERKNALESYVYDMRSKLETNLAEFIAEKNKEKFMKALNEMEDWLYGEGEDTTKSIYVKKLEELEKMGTPVITRFREFEERPNAIRSFRDVVTDFTNQASSKDEKFAHIPQADKDKVLKECKNKLDWLNSNLSKQEKQAKADDPVVTVAKILQERDALVAFARPLMNKPKPKPAKEEKKPESPKKEAQGEMKTPTEDTAEKMDVDETPAA